MTTKEGHVPKDATADIDDSVILELASDHVKEDDIDGGRNDVTNGGGDENENLSQAVWMELQKRLKQTALIEDEDETTFAFEPYPSAPIKQETYETHEEIPGGVVALDVIDPEESFQRFLGKSFDPTDVDFSDDRTKIKPRSEEVVHGWGHALQESFRERLGRLRREIPEIVSALERFEGYPKALSCKEESIDAKLLVELNTSLSEMKDEAEEKLGAMARESRGYQRLVHGADHNGVYMLDGFKETNPTNVSISQLLNPFITSEQIDKKVAKGGGVQTSLDLRAMRDVERSEVSRLIVDLEKRVEFLSAQTQSPANDVSFISEGNTLKDVMTQLMEVFDLIQTEERKKDEGNATEDNQAGAVVAPLETQLRAVQANLELLEGVPPRPDSEEVKSSLEYKYFSHLDVWDPDKRINELSLLAHKNNGCRNFVEQLRRALSDQATTHRNTAETLGRLKHAEGLQTDLKSLLTLNTKSIIEMETSINDHREQLSAIKQALKH